MIPNRSVSASRARYLPRAMRPTWVLFASALALACGSNDDESGGGSGGTGGSAGPWRKEAPLPAAAASLSATESGGKIWVAGGVDGSVSKKVWSYDPATGTWSAGPDLPEARELPGMASVGGDVYAVGGFGDVDATPTDSTYVLKAGASSWQKLSSLLLNRAGAFATTLTDRIYLVGGMGDAQLLGDTVAFDPGTNSWSVKAAIPNPRVRFAGFVLSGWIHAVGGTSESGGVTNKVDIYEPGGNVWTLGPDFPTPRDGLGAAVLDGKAYVVGGDAAGTVDVFDGAAWSSAPPLGTPRIGAAVVAVAGRVYVIGGALPGGGASDVVESYAP